MKLWFRTIALLLLPAGHLLATGTTNSSNFNGTSIADTSWIWFNSHITTASGFTNPVTLFFKNQHITFTSTTTALSYDLLVPDAQITINSSVGTPSTVFSGGTWQTTVSSTSGNPFLAGYSFDVPTGEDPKAANPVTWRGDFFASQPGVSVSWQWAAAVYTTFTNNYNLLGVTPIDGFGGFSQSGTPANFTGFVTGGARGGGGSNYTGSNSGTASVVNLTVIPEPTVATLLVVGATVGILRSRRNRRS